MSLLISTELWNFLNPVECIRNASGDAVLSVRVFWQEWFRKKESVPLYEALAPAAGIAAFDVGDSHIGL